MKYNFDNIEIRTSLECWKWIKSEYRAYGTKEIYNNNNNLDTYISETWFDKDEFLRSLVYNLYEKPFYIKLSKNLIVSDKDREESIISKSLVFSATEVQEEIKVLFPNHYIEFGDLKATKGNTIPFYRCNPKSNIQRIMEKLS